MGACTFVLFRGHKTTLSPPSSMLSENIIQFKRIYPEETWLLRQQVLWPQKPVSYVQLPEDAAGLHFGLLVDGILVSVASLFIKENQAQFRKFATATSAQGKGYGSKLLMHILQQVPALSVHRIWCNARENKAGYYQRFGFQETSEKFEKEGMQYVVMEKLLVVLKK